MMCCSTRGEREEYESFNGCIEWFYHAIMGFSPVNTVPLEELTSKQKLTRCLFWSAVIGVVLTGAVGGIKYLEDGKGNSVTNIYGSDDTNDDNNNVDTFSPTLAPTITPTLIPTINSPSFSPTPHPTVGPTLSPTLDQSNSPTFSPTPDQSNSPIPFPSFSPSFSPTTNSPTISSTTNSPTLGSTTNSPTLGSTTNSPTLGSTTLSPTTNSPTISSTTNSPTISSTTNSPTISSTTNSPTLGSTTLSPTTNSPTISSTTNSPTLGSTTLSPTAMTGTTFLYDDTNSNIPSCIPGATVCTGNFCAGFTIEGSDTYTVTINGCTTSSVTTIGDCPASGTSFTGTAEQCNTWLASNAESECEFIFIPTSGEIDMSLTVKDSTGTTLYDDTIAVDTVSTSTISLVQTRDFIKTDPAFKEYLTKEETRNAQWSHMRQEGGAVSKEQADFIRDYVKQQLENYSELESSQDYMNYCYLRGVAPQWSQSSDTLERFMMLKQYQHFKPGVCEFVDAQYDDQEDLNVLLDDPYVQAYANLNKISLENMGSCTIYRLSQFEKVCTYYRSKHHDDMAPDATTQEIITAIDQAIHQEVAEASTPGGVFSTHEYNQYVSFQKWPPTHDAYDLYLRLENFQGYQRHVKRIETSMNEDLYGSKQGELHVPGLNTKFCDFINNKLSVAEFNEMEPEQRDQLQSDFIAEQLVALNEEISTEKMADLSDYARSIGVDMSTASPTVELYAKINYKAFLNFHDNHAVVSSSEFLDHAATYNRIPTNDVQMNEVLTEYEGGPLWKLASKAYSAVTSTASSLLFGGKQQPSGLTCPSKEDFSNNLRGNIETLPMMRRLMGGR